MKSFDVAALRLHNLQLSDHKCTKPEEVVAYLGAMQAQDYGAAKWAIGLRLPGITDDEIEAAFNAGSILRTHIMRPTWHFVAPEDIGWMQQLTAPRVRKLLSVYNKKLELTEAVFKKSNKIVTQALRNGNVLARSELATRLQKAGIVTNELRLVHLVMWAELDGVICSGPRKGKQFTYALLEERAPNPKSLQRDEALAELARRYFTSHGPATVNDFAWWSGLNAADSREGLEMIKSELLCEVVGVNTYWFPAGTKSAKPPSSTYLLPNYDEFTVAYKDRSAVVTADRLKPSSGNQRDHVIFNNVIVDKGMVCGTWKRKIRTNDVELSFDTFADRAPTVDKAIMRAASAYGKFLGLPIRTL